MKKSIISLMLAIGTSFSGSLVYSQLDDPEKLLNLSLEDLINISVTVTSKSTETPRDAANVLSVITALDIESNMCRDMVDVLNMVPGFTITKDDDYTSFSSRGLYSFEGRTLIMVDGMQLSDLYFGSYILGNDFPIHLIKRIEVIRGPGSVLYGGTAELAVINIITYDGNDLNGGNINIRHGQIKNSYGHRDIGMNYGIKNGKLEISTLGFVGQGMRSSDTARYVGRNTAYLHNWESAGLQSSSFNFKATYNQNTHMSFSKFYYYNNQVRGFDTTDDSSATGASTFLNIKDAIAARKVTYENNNIVGDVHHEIKINKVIIIPGYNMQYSYPLKRQPVREEVSTIRLKPYLYGVYQSEDFQLTAGGEFFSDYSLIHRPNPNEQVNKLRKSVLDTAGSDAISIYNLAFFSNLKYQFFISDIKFNISGGFRYDKNELYGSKLNPRAGLNIQYNKLHAKLLYSSAFRAPLVANNAFSRYGINPDTTLNTRIKTGVKPEEVQVVEFEIGYMLSQNFMITANAYQQVINNIIEFRFNYKNGDLYSDNGGKIGTRGIETELKCQTKKYRAVINYSLVNPIFYDDENQWAYSYNNPKGGDTYITPDADSIGNPTNLNLLGVPYHKIYSNHTINLSNHLSVNFNTLILSSMWAYNGSGTSKKVDAQIIPSIGLRYQYKNATILLNAHDFLNRKMKIASAWYEGVYDVLSYKGREISIALSFNF